MRFPLPTRESARPAEILVVRPDRGAVRARFGLVRRIEDARRTVHFVRAALRDHVERDARNRDRRIRSAGRRLHLLERVEVIVSGGCAERRHVRHAHAVDEPGILRRIDALADVDGLLAALAARHVGPVDLDRRHLLEHDPGVARRRDALQLVLCEVRSRAHPARVEQRRLGRHRDRRRHRGDLHRNRQLRVRPEAHRHVRALDGRKTVELRLDGVAPGGEVQEAKFPLASRRRGSRAAPAGQRDGDPGQCPARFVRHLPVNVAVRRRSSLSEQGRGADGCHQTDGEKSEHLHKTPSRPFRPLLTSTSHSGASEAELRKEQRRCHGAARAVSTN